MSRYIEGEPRTQSVLLPERLDDWIQEDNPVRVIDAFLEKLDLRSLGFDGAVPAETTRSAYHHAAAAVCRAPAAGGRGSTSVFAPSEDDRREVRGNRILATLGAWGDCGWWDFMDNYS